MTKDSTIKERKNINLDLIALIVSTIAIIVSFWTYNNSSKLQKEITAYTYWQSYLQQALSNPEFASGRHANNDSTNNAYAWFVSNALGSAEQIYRLQKNDEGWTETVKTVISDHKDYIIDTSFKSKHYGQEFRDLMEKTLSIKFKK